MVHLKKQASLALLYFFIVSLMGLLLRLFYVFDFNLNYRHFLHAHSHTAILGWIYLGLTTLIYKLFLEKAEKPKLYKRIFFVTNLSILGMLIAFPIQGYALFSISFSTLFILSSYWFTWFCFKYIPAEYKSRFSWKLVKMALFYLVLSSLGTWAIGPVVAIKGLQSSLFNNTLYFFLHFMSNGWFYLSLSGILFYIFETQNIKFSPKALDLFYAYFNIGVFLSFFLSVLWVKPVIIFYILGSVGAIYQILGVIIIYRNMKSQMTSFKSLFLPFSKKLIKLAGALFALKLFLQLISAIPYFANLAFHYRDFIIWYLHLEFLGIVVLLLFVFLRYFNLIKLPKYSLNIFLVAFATTELLIFYHAVAMWLKLPNLPYYTQILAGLTILLPVAIGMITFKNIYLLFKSSNGH